MSRDRTHRSTRTPGRPRADGGFALLVVIFLLFAVGVAATAAYQVVFTEHRQSGFSTDAERAQIIAEAGLNRFIGEAASGIPDDADYFLDDGEAQVSARRILHLGPWAEMYRVHSVGRVTDPRLFDAPAVREAARYARFRAPPFNVLAPFVTTAEAVTVQADFVVDGEDLAPPGGSGSCRQSQDGWEPMFDLVAGGGVSGAGSGGLVVPTPPWNPGEVLAALQAPSWAALSDPDYPVDCEGPPNSCSFPAGTFPVYRVLGNFNANNLQSGEGVLIVTGTLGLQANFQWDGIILSGGITSTVDADNMVVRGLVLVGLAAPPPSVELMRGSFRFHSCNVAEAGRSMGVLNAEARSFWSAF